MTLVFVSTRADIRRAIAWMSRPQAKSAAVIALEWEAQDEADRRGLPLRAFEEYLENGRWRVFDVWNGVVFQRHFESFVPPPVPDVLQVSKQMPRLRLVYEVRRALGLEGEDE